MKLLFLRHADPDYAHDSLTPNGVEEAKALRDYLSSLPIDKAFVSPLGRAKQTMEIALSSPRHQNLTPIVLDFLREFDADVPGQSRTHIAWDFLPEELEEERELLSSPSRWMEAKIYSSSPDLKEKVEAVFAGFDSLLKEEGYVRIGNHYETTKGHQRTLAFFCHFGIESLLLSHLVSASPVVFWHGTCAAPSSITEVYTEERREGKVSFRIAHFGETAHLKMAGREDSFSARFSETFLDPRRHD
ncbi:MAG: histidine phosphatase family protein [Candidatus Enteromonas sp.]|nr:histidine phosphatase family protein [Candidatus Enteromonas sp.]